MNILDKAKIIKLEFEIKRLKKIPYIERHITLESELERLENESRHKSEAIGELSNLLGYVMAYIGKPIEIDKRALYYRKFNFETTTNMQNNNLIIRGGNLNETKTNCRVSDGNE